MELQALLVLCGVAVAGAAVLLLMGLFSASGTSYEEAIAQQRRATSELLALADNKNKSKKTNKKANKKLAKKEKKENALAATGSEPESEAPAESGVEDEPGSSKHHVEFSPEIVVDPPTDNTSNAKIRKRGKDPKIKPILVNKEDPSCVSDPSTAATPIAEVSNHFEEMHPKDEIELLQSALEKETEKKEEKKEEVVEKKESKPSKQSKGGKAAAKQSAPEPTKEEPAEKQTVSEKTEAPLEQRKVKKAEKKAANETPDVKEVVPPLNTPQPSELTTEKLLRQTLQAAPAPSPPAKSKKKKADQDVLALLGAEGGVVPVGDLVRVVRQATLSRDEIQILTDALLNKHHDLLPEHSEWTEGPNDPMQKLKKQLSDKEKALQDELEASQALNAKVKELRKSLNGANVEVHTLQTRLTRVLEEHRALVQDKLTLQAQINENEAQAARMQNMELHIQRVSESEAALGSQLAALRAELTARTVEAGQARCEAVAARDEAILAQQHNTELAQQLQEANLAYAEVEQQRQFAIHAEQLAQQELRQLQARLAGVTELQNDLQRLTGRAQAAESNADKLKEEMEKQKEELTKEIQSLQEQVSAREAELAEIKQLKAAPAHNGLPPSTGHDEQKAAELAKVESMVESLRNELVAAQQSSADQKTQLATLQEQLAQYRDKNNEAIAKAQEQHFMEVANVLRAVSPTAAPNSAIGSEWLQNFAENLKKELSTKETEKQQVEKDLLTKLSEKENERKELETEMQKRLQEKELAIKEAESKLQQQLTNKDIETEIQKKLHEKELALKETEEKLQQQIKDKELASKKIEFELLKKIEEELKAKKKLESELLQKLQEELNIKIQLESELKNKDKIQQQVVDDSRVSDLEKKNEHLQGLVDKYKRIIDETEGVLSLLQQKVSTEEQRWQQQLADQRRELESLQQRSVQQMQHKIDSLQMELQKVQTRNHSNSFADAERIAQEKLMAGCAANLVADAHNGPVQEQIILSDI